MNTYRKNAIIAGILFILCSATCIIGGILAASMLDKSDYLAQLAGNQNKAIIAAIFELIWAATGVGIAIALYPVIKKHNEGLALGSVIFRGFENVCVIIGVLCLLALLTFSQGAGASDAAGRLFLGMRDWATQVVAVMFFTLGALMYYIVLYKSKLIPRWLSGWGLIGALLGLAAVVIGAFNRELLTGSFNTILNVPIALQEMVLAVWLIVKGFNHSAIAFLSAKTAANGLLSKS